MGSGVSCGGPSRVARPVEVVAALQLVPALRAPWPSHAVAGASLAAPCLQEPPAASVLAASVRLLLSQSAEWARSGPSQWRRAGGGTGWARDDRRR